MFQCRRFFKNKDKISTELTKRTNYIVFSGRNLWCSGLFADKSRTRNRCGSNAYDHSDAAIFFFAMYEKDGFPAEKILLHIIRQKFLRPGIRVYRSQNLYDRIIEYDKLEKEGAWLEKKAKEAREARNPFQFTLKKQDRKNKETENRTYERRKKASERTSDDKSGESEEEEAFYSAGYDSI